jgi:hypothetical protein
MDKSRFDLDNIGICIIVYYIVECAGWAIAESQTRWNLCMRFVLLFVQLFTYMGTLFMSCNTAGKCPADRLHSQVASLYTVRGG